MIVDLPDTTTNAIAKALVNLREEGGAVALGRVLTLIIATPLGDEEEAIEAANAASREHPMRVIVLSKHPEGRQLEAARLDAEIRVGGDAGASEVIVLRAHGDTAADEEGLVTGLLLPDAPVVVWWPQIAPLSPSSSPLGKMAQRRITDAAAAPNPLQALESLDPPDPVACAARGGARPAPLRDHHRHPGRGILRLALDRAAGRLAAAAARGPGHA
jgi:glucose-6-phosphate dehydrogenase assembly protein OpcA